MSMYLTEEEQLQTIKKWWQKYNIIIIVVLSVIMLVTTGYKYFVWKQQNILANASNLYEQLIVAFSNNNTQQIKSYSNKIITDYKNTIYADAAYMTLAKLAVINNQYDQAYKLLNIVADQSKLVAFKQIAKIRMARILLIMKKFTEALNQLVKIDDSAYIGVVNELKGDIYLKLGDYNKALDLYKQAAEVTKKHGLGNLFLEMKINDLHA